MLNIILDQRNHYYRPEKIGFTNFRQLNGGMKTDFDKPFLEDKYFSEKYGSGI